MIIVCVFFKPYWLQLRNIDAIVHECAFVHIHTDQLFDQFHTFITIKVHVLCFESSVPRVWSVLEVNSLKNKGSTALYIPQALCKYFKKASATVNEPKTR